MPKQAVIPLKGPRFLRVVAEEITDPAERAAIDKLRKRRKRKSASLPLRIVRFQRVIAEEITDPAERAAIDRMRKRLKRKAGQKKKA